MNHLALSITNLSVQCGGKSILNDITLNIESGAFVGVVGENGSGKTTLLRTISGLVPFSQGEVLIFDRSIKEMSRREIAQSISFLPQKLSPFMPLSVKEFILMGRFVHVHSPRGYSSADFDAVHDVLSVLGIESLGERIYSELSGGEQQKVLIACSLVQGAQILIFDEPDSFLDQKQKSILFETFVSIQKQRALTLIVASHDLSRIKKYASTTILLREKTLEVFEESLIWG